MRGGWCVQVRKLLLRLDSSRRHVRNWRPQLLLLLSLSSGSGGGGGGGGANGAEALAETLNHIKKSGLLLLGHVVPTEPAGGGASRLSDATPRSLSRSYSARPSPSFGGGDAWMAAARACQQRQRDLLDQIDSSGWKAFPAVAMAGSLLSGVQSLVSGGAGLGSLAPNTVCFGFLKQGSAGWSEILTAI